MTARIRLWPGDARAYPARGCQRFWVQAALGALTFVLCGVAALLILLATEEIESAVWAQAAMFGAAIVPLLLRAGVVYYAHSRLRLRRLWVGVLAAAALAAVTAGACVLGMNLFA